LPRPLEGEAMAFIFTLLPIVNTGKGVRFGPKVCLRLHNPLFPRY